MSFDKPPAGPVCAAALRLRISSDGNDTICYQDTGFHFEPLAPATPNDIPFICTSAACKAVVDIARAIATAECVVHAKYYLYQDILNPIVRVCANVTTTSTPSTATPARTGEAALSTNWTIATTAPPASTARYVPPSSGANALNDSDVSTPAYVFGAVFVVIVLAAIVNSISQGQKQKATVQRDQYLVYGHEDGDGDLASSAPSAYAKIDGGEHSSCTVTNPSAPTTSLLSEPASRSSNVSVDLSTLPLLNDAQIIAVRVPFAKVSLGDRLTAGGYGEVYKAIYKDETVAIKKMLPEHRRDERLVTKFLEEVKLMASLDHEHIVRFVGVAWDSPSDICVLTEFMDGGDLRSLLKRYEAENRPEGFDGAKIKIALHVAHAITYMHSLQPALLHRDLKSTNILLSQAMDAKLTDFGVSRERADATMTRGVGTSLWMAPEIMLGGRYDEKADIFSFGVVLSELDSNKLPYANQLDLTNAKNNYGEIMQSVAHGRLTVDFSYESDPDIVALGRDCVALDPQDRPAAAEVLHRVHQVLRQFSAVLTTDPNMTL